MKANMKKKIRWKLIAVSWPITFHILQNDGASLHNYKSKTEELIVYIMKDLESVA